MAGQKRQAEQGDVVEIVGRHVGDSPRHGEVVAVLGEKGHEHYRIRWEDGHETVAYQLGTDAVVRHPSENETAA